MTQLSNERRRGAAAPTIGSAAPTIGSAVTVVPLGETVSLLEPRSALALDRSQRRLREVVKWANEKLQAHDKTVSLEEIESTAVPHAASRLRKVVWNNATLGQVLLPDATTEELIDSFPHALVSLSSAENNDQLRAYVGVLRAASRSPTMYVSSVCYVYFHLTVILSSAESPYAFLPYAYVFGYNMCNSVTSPLTCAVGISTPCAWLSRRLSKTSNSRTMYSARSRY